MISDLRNMIKTLQATMDAANKQEEALIQERDHLKDEVSSSPEAFWFSSEKRDD